MEFRLLVATVKPGVTDRVVDAAKAAGARGATIVPGHGTGSQEAKTFFGMTLEMQTDVVLMLLQADIVEDVMSAIGEAGEFDKPGTGIAFTLDVGKTIGLESQLVDRG